MSSHSTNGSLDATLSALSHSVRRYVLRYLDREPDAVPVETLAAAVAAWQTGDEGSARDPEARGRAHAALRHVHLPRLESAGLVERTRSVEGAESDPAESGEYVEATTDDTPADAFLDAGLLGGFEPRDRP